MKKLIVSVVLLLCPSFIFASAKLTALTQDTTAQATDLIYKVDNPSGTPLSRSISVGNLFSGTTYFIFNQNTLQTNATFYVSSGSIAGQFSPITIKWPDGTVQVSSPTTVSLSTTTAGANSFIFNQNTLQSGSTFYVSSGAVNGQLSASSIKFPNGTIQVSSPTSNSPGGSSGQLEYNNSGVFGGTAAGTYLTSGNLFTLQAQAATDKPLIVKGATSQSVNLQEWQSSGGSALSVVDSAGRLGVALASPSTNYNAQIGAASSGINRSGLLVGISANTGYSILRLETLYGRAFGTGDFLTCVSNGVPSFVIDSNGGLTTLGQANFGIAGAGSNTSGHTFNWSPNSGFYVAKFATGFGTGVGNGDILQIASASGVLDVFTSAGYLGVGTISPGAQLHVTASGTTVVGQIINGAASQSANLQEWQNSSGVVLSSVSASGNITASTVTATTAFVFQDGTRQTTAAGGAASIPFTGALFVGLTSGSTFQAFVPTRAITLKNISFMVDVASAGGSGDTLVCADASSNSLSVTSANAAAAGTFTSAAGSVNISAGTTVYMRLDSAAVTKPQGNATCTYVMQ